MHPITTPYFLHLDTVALPAMRIAQIAPIVERVPPKKYGGTERVIYHLTEELVKRGHEVTLFASGDSETSAKLSSVVPVALREMPNEKDIYGFNVFSMLNSGEAYKRQSEFDIIHDHNPLIGLPAANLVRTPVVMTWHGPYEKDLIEYFAKLNRTHLVSISDSQASRAPQLKFAGTVYNGLPLHESPFSAEPGKYLLYVGRIDKEKGVHLAMDAAARTPHKLILAAKLDDHVPEIKKYFEGYIKPRLKKYEGKVEWIGEVDAQRRDELMKGAICLLHAVTWPEPFGLTLIESMACGCPVIAFNMGSIPEIVRNGVTGFVVSNVTEMAEAIGKIGQIDRRACREHVLVNFTASRMADGYLEVYKKILRPPQDVALMKMREKRLTL